MKIYIIILFYLLSVSLKSQEKIKKDTLVKLDEIIIKSRRGISNYRQTKTLSSIDAYLEKSNKITMIKRGNYAWEASLHNMVTDRLNITIDGMKIYGACTDKMDPVTSYVDVSNLETVNISSGQEGTENGNCIGGSINLKLPSSKFYNTGLKGNIDAGFETNGNYTSTSGNIAYSSDKFYLNTDGIFRKSKNYKAGGNIEILYSQFQKYNISIQTGYKLSKKHHLQATLIYDKATNVGYPALPMDVSLAKATITSISHHFKSTKTALHHCETKIYFNTITHTMDDTKRPIVPIRMDMPGWSDTYGMYSKVMFKIKNHHLSFNVNTHYNRSLAEMTMYPNNPNENSMFMYTWPDVKTVVSGMYIKDLWNLGNGKKIQFTTRLGYHHNKIDNKVGLQSLQIYYPKMEKQKNRILGSFFSKYTIKTLLFNMNFGIGYGERAPSISEGYGFYLFNSFDKYDYIGNPTLKNEKSLEGSFSINLKKKNFNIQLESNYFYISDYIIGKTDPTLIAMTIGANGVRIYKALPNATVFSTVISGNYHFSKKININASLGYNYGKGSDGNNLPLISPISYYTELNYTTHTFNTSVRLKGNRTQTNYSVAYGEDKTAGYTILDLNFGNKFTINNNKMIIKYGIENLLDKNYSTYADWNNFPRKGRNFYINVSYLIR